MNFVQCNANVAMKIQKRRRRKLHVIWLQIHLEHLNVAFEVLRLFF